MLTYLHSLGVTAEMLHTTLFLKILPILKDSTTLYNQIKNC